MIRCQLKKAHHEVQVLHNTLTCLKELDLFIMHASTSNYILKSWNYLTAPKSLLEMVEVIKTVDNEER